MKKTYKAPEMATVIISSVDIMNGSDTFIDVGNLWNTTTSED